MPQFTIKADLGLNNTCNINGLDARHISDVLRLKAGNWIEISDGRGQRFRAEIISVKKGAVEIIPKEKLPDLIINDITLAQAVIKNDKIEFIIQKSVELGVTRIVPFISERTVPKYSETAAAKKTGRWNRIAAEAAKQCGIPVKPVVTSPVTFDKLIKSSTDYSCKILFYEGNKSSSIKNCGTEAPKHHNTIITIGPEGGFTDNEINRAKSAGFKIAGLGPLILRADTAALTAVALLQYQLGYFG